MAPVVKRSSRNSEACARVEAQTESGCCQGTERNDGDSM